MADLDRSLRVYADDMLLSGFRRARLTGHDALGLYPMPFVLRLWNLAEADYLLLCSAKMLSGCSLSPVSRSAKPSSCTEPATFSRFRMP